MGMLKEQESSPSDWESSAGYHRIDDFKEVDSESQSGTDGARPLLPDPSRQCGSSNNRIIIAMDMDAFYCTVEEKDDPSLVNTPFIIAQKNCIATLSYAARELGLKKLGLVSEAIYKFGIDPNFQNAVGNANARVPEGCLRVVNGENLSKYRKQGKKIYSFMNNSIFGNQVPVERLGMEEMWIDVTTVVEKNLQRILASASEMLFQQVSKQDNDNDNNSNNNYITVANEVDDCMSQGWRLVLRGDFDASSGIMADELIDEPQPGDDQDTSFETYSFIARDFFFNTPAKVFPFDHGTEMPSFLANSDSRVGDPYLDFKLYIGSHIANHLMERMDLSLGYSCSMGVATNKTLAKMVTSLNKPKGLSLILSSHSEVCKQFMLPKSLGQIPGFGSAIRKAIWKHVNSSEKQTDGLRVETVLKTFGNEQENGLQKFVDAVRSVIAESKAVSLWELLQGNDQSPVSSHGSEMLDISDQIGMSQNGDWYPKSQISVEDTFGTLSGSKTSGRGLISRPRITKRRQVYEQVKRLSNELIEQIHEDLVDANSMQLKAYPTIFRLTTRDWNWVRQQGQKTASSTTTTTATTPANSTTFLNNFDNSNNYSYSKCRVSKSVAIPDAEEFYYHISRLGLSGSIDSDNRRRVRETISEKCVKIYMRLYDEILQKEREKKEKKNGWLFERKKPKQKEEKEEKEEEEEEEKVIDLNILNLAVTGNSAALAESQEQAATKARLATGRIDQRRSQEEKKDK